MKVSKTVANQAMKWASKVEAAPTRLDEAQRLELLAKIEDWYRSKVLREGDLLTSVASDDFVQDVMDVQSEIYLPPLPGPSWDRHDESFEDLPPVQIDSEDDEDAWLVFANELRDIGAPIVIPAAGRRRLMRYEKTLQAQLHAVRKLLGR